MAGSVWRVAALAAAALALAWGAGEHLGWQLQTPALLAPAPSAASALRKCLPASGSGAVLYSSSACPAGTREQAIAGGTVNVLPSVAAVAAAKPASAHKPLLQRLAPPEEAAALREKRMERAIQP